MILFFQLLAISAIAAAVGVVVVGEWQKRGKAERLERRYFFDDDDLGGWA